MSEQRWPQEVWSCPRCHQVLGIRVRSKGANCAGSYTEGPAHTVCAMERVAVVPVGSVVPTPEQIEAGAEAIRNFLGGDWRKHNGGAGLAEIVLRAALAVSTEENQ